MLQFKTYALKEGYTSKVIQITGFTELPNALQKLGLRSNQPTLVLVGGADQISSADYEHVQQLFLQVVVPVVEQSGAVVVDGGTNKGIMQLMGCARATLNTTFPVVGVAPIVKIRLPGVPVGRSATEFLEPNHTHFILVPGNDWGDESPWLARVSSLLSQGCPSFTLVINGGSATLMDAVSSIREGRHTVLLSGSGRTADRLAAALKNPEKGVEENEHVKEMLISGLLQAIDMNQSFEVTAEKLRQLLSIEKR